MDTLNMSDIDGRLEGIEKRIDRQDHLLDRVSDSLKELVRLSERQVAQAERSEERWVSINSRIENIDQRVTANHEKIIRWAAIGSALVALIGIAATVVSMYAQLA